MLDVGCWMLSVSCPLAKTFGVERLLLSALRLAAPRSEATASLPIIACRIEIIRQLHGMLSPTSVKDALQSAAPVAPIQLQGWVRTRRDSKDFSFIELNDGSSLRNLQIIAKSSLPNYAAVPRLHPGAY